MTQFLQDKVAIVTGGSAGIGKAIALKFAQHGAKVNIVAKNPERGDQALKEIRLAVPEAQVEFWSVDVSNTDDVKTTIDQISQKYGCIDILVNNAGVTRDQLLMKMSEDDWDHVLDVNAKSCFNTSKAVVRGMLKARKGKIINVTSVVGLTGNAGQGNYAASKAAIIGFTKSLAKELGPRNIAVNCIAPGFITTDMTSKMPDNWKEAQIQMIPLGRAGQPEEIANGALFLASGLGDYVTGQVLVIDGGMVT